MMGRFLYFLLIMFLARLAWSSIMGWLTGQARRQVGAPGASGSGSPGADADTVHGGTMVRDPVCGLHLLPRHAITRVGSGETLYFCSERCRSAYVETT